MGSDEHWDAFLDACAIATVSGATIEAGYAREQGRVPHIDHNADVAVARIKANWGELGLPTEQIDSRLKETYTTNIGVVLASLMAAGM